jgi:hypothetical protein
MKLRLTLSILILVVCGLADASAATGVRGRIAWRGELVEGVRVYAYHNVDDIAAGRVLATSEPAATDGTYRLDLPPGAYVLVARDFNGSPQPGNHFCYYSGSPIQVVAGRQTNVGFNLIRIPQEEPPKKGGASGLYGEVSFQDQPLEKVYLYVYKEAGRGFKGPAYFIQPVEKGSFRLRLPPGDYYLLARKRAKGGQFGPIEIGDYFNFYFANPVRVKSGEMRHIRLETITRLSMLEEGETLPFHGVRGQIRDAAGNPAAGLHVFAYRNSVMTGTPDAFSAATGGDGQFELALPDAGPWYLLAREQFGGPAASGERYGHYAGGNGAAVRLAEDGSVQEIKIYVEPQSD